jgi:hypothetical protein
MAPFPPELGRVLLIRYLFELRSFQFHRVL